ncbi:MAG: AraC family transcriptional regulator [Pseudomonadales bacterium]|nr:AraC family transcriptional regulator [Pseudomonadales bacterium]
MFWFKKANGVMSTDPKTELKALHFPMQYVEIVESMLRQRGADAQTMLSRCGLDWSNLDTRKGVLNGEQFKQLLEICQEVADPDKPVSVQILEHVPLTAHGILGIVILTSPTLDCAMQAALRFYPVVMPAYDIHAEAIGEQVHVVIKSLTDFGSVQTLLTETLLGAFNSICQFIKPELALFDLYFAHPMQFSSQGYETVADPERVFFSQPCDKIVVDKRNLGAALLTANKTTMQIFEAQLEAQIREIQHSMVYTQETRQIIRQLIRAGKIFSVDDVASEMGSSSRTLSRHLQQEGTSYSSLVQDERIEFAEVLLLNTRKNISQVAHLAGFTNESSFSRAFKRHKGIAPSALKRIG